MRLKIKPLAVQFAYQPLRQFIPVFQFELPDEGTKHSLNYAARDLMQISVIPGPLPDLASSEGMRKFASPPIGSKIIISRTSIHRAGRVRRTGILYLDFDGLIRPLPKPLNTPSKLQIHKATHNWNLTGEFS